MGARRFRSGGAQLFERLARQHPAGPAQIVHQVHVSGPLGERSLETGGRLGIFTHLELRHAQSIECVHLLEMRNRLVRVSRCQQGKPQQLVRSLQIGIQLEGVLQRSYRALIITRLHQCLPQPHESRGQFRRLLRGLAELSRGLSRAALTQRVAARFQMCEDVGRGALPEEQKNDRQPGHHGRSGSTTVRNRSAGTSYMFCTTPEGHVISTLALVAVPKPKWTRLSLADK